MAVAVIMPRQGQSVESCIITKWHKKVGEPVKAGDLLFSYETDKASFDEEAKADGVLLKILVDEDEDVPVLEPVAVIGAEGEDVSSFGGSAEPAATAPADAPAALAAGASSVASGAPSAPAATGTPAAPVAPANPSAPLLPATPGDGRLKVSPRARALAETQGLDPAMAIPTGPDGRIIERDIIELAKHADDQPALAAPHAPAPGAPAPGAAAPLTAAIGAAATAAATLAAPPHPAAPGAPAAAPGAPVPAPHPAPAAPPAPPAPGSPDAAFEDVKLSGVRKAIAKSMHASLSQMAQLTHTSSFDATDILAYRASLKRTAESLGLGNITLNDMVMYAVSRVLLDFPDLNAHYLDDKIRRFSSVNLGMAVDTPRGLLVPTIFGANRLSLNELSAAAKRLAKAAQEGAISPDLLSGASFTVSNLGSFGIESFTPVINPPQTGILGVDTITTRLKMADGEPVAYQAMGLSLTYDHRALDGAPASKFLQKLCSTLENFTALLAK